MSSESAFYNPRPQSHLQIDISIAPELQSHCNIHLNDAVRMLRFFKNVTSCIMSGARVLIHHCRLSPRSQDEASHLWDFQMLLGLNLLPPLGPPITQRAITEWRDELFGHIAPHNPQRFRDRLRSCAGVIGGSAVLHALEYRDLSSAPWQPNAYDIFIPPATFTAFCTYLINECGGTVMARTAFSDTKCTRRVSETRTIQTTKATLTVFCTVDACPLTAIAASRLDIQFTFLSADALCVAYPWAVFLKNATARPSPRSSIGDELERVDPSVETYARRGYTFGSPPPESRGPCLQHGMCPRTIRHFGDEHCLTIYFSDSRHARSTVTSSREGLFLTAAWTLGGPPCGNLSCAYSVAAGVDTCTICSTTSLF